MVYEEIHFLVLYNENNDALMNAYDLNPFPYFDNHWDSENDGDKTDETLNKKVTKSSAEFMTLTDKGLIKGRNGSNKSEYITVAGERIKVAW